MNKGAVSFTRNVGGLLYGLVKGDSTSTVNERELTKEEEMQLLKERLKHLQEQESVDEQQGNRKRPRTSD